MKKLYLFLSFFAATAGAQSFQWLDAPQIDLQLNPGMVGYSSAVDDSGNSYVAGFLDNAFPYTDIFGDVLFNKYDAGGQLQLSKTFTGRVTVFDMAIDSDGNIVMIIAYVNTATIDQLELNTEDQGVQPLVAKFDSEGNLLWHYIPTIEGSFAPSLNAVAVDSGNNVYIGYDNFMGSYIRKLSPQGVSEFVIVNENVRMVSSVDVDADGNIYASGSCAESNAEFAGVSLPTDLDYNTWIAKYSPDGVFQWARFVEDITCSRSIVKVGQPDQVYFSSALYGAFDFGGITAEGPNNNFNGDFFVARLNADGDFQWVREVPAGSIGTVTTGMRNFLDADAEGNVVFGGGMRNVISWGNDIQTSAQGFSGEALVLKYDNAGTLLFAKTFGGVSEDRVDGVSFDANGDIIVSGMARGTATFDTFTVETPGVTNFPYIGKISGGALGNPQYSAETFALWPNPASETLHFSAQISGDIFNAIGQKVKTFSNAVSMPVNDLPHGVYIVRANRGSARFVKS